MGGPPARGLGKGPTTLHRKNKFVTNILNEPWTWMVCLENNPRQI
jgi:hypothetical protein